MNFKKILKWVGFVLMLLILTAGILYATYLRPFMEDMKKTTIISYGKELTLVIGGGGNSGIITSDSLVIVIDTKMDDAAKMLQGMVKQRAGKKPVLIINTHFHPDHTKGNNLYKGATIMAGGNYTPEMWEDEAGKKGVPSKWLKDRMDIKMGDDTVTILNLGKNIHTPSDVVVYLHKYKMLFAGDLILNKQAPAIFGSADPDAYLTAFDFLQKKFDIEKIVPGHGVVGGIEILENFREYFNDMKLAATDDSKKEALLLKYENWGQIPVLMSPGATVRAFKKKMDK